LFRSVAVSTHVPLHGLSPESSHRHSDSTHLKPAPHAFPQAPQFAASDERSLHTPPQSVSPLGQTQSPSWQAFPPLQAMPQLPQLLLSE